MSEVRGVSQTFVMQVESRHHRPPAAGCSRRIKNMSVIITRDETQQQRIPPGRPLLTCWRPTFIIKPGDSRATNKPYGWRCPTVIQAENEFPLRDSNSYRTSVSDNPNLPWISDSSDPYQWTLDFRFKYPDWHRISVSEIVPN